MRAETSLRGCLHLAKKVRASADVAVGNIATSTSPESHEDMDLQEVVVRLRKMRKAYFT